MTMLDDDRLDALFGRAGAAFDVPASGPDDILARAAGRPQPGARGEEDAGEEDAGEEALDGTTTRPGRLRRLSGLAGRHRVLSVAACIVVLVVLAGAVGAVARSTARPSRTAALAKEPGHVPAHAPQTTTTVPSFQSSGAGQSQLARPFGTAGTSGRASTDARPVPQRRAPRHCRTAPSASPPRSSRPGHWG